MNGSLIMWLVIIVCLGIFAVAVWYLFSVLFGRGEELAPVEHSDLMAANAQAIAEGRFADLRFELVPRGYRQDQVDAVIELLAPAGGGVNLGAGDHTEGEDAHGSDETADR